MAGHNKRPHFRQLVRRRRAAGRCKPANFIGHCLKEWDENMNKQLFIYCDMEGASQITEENREALCHGSLQWSTFGKDCITSDVKAVCAAAVEFGIDDILIYDGHYAGNPEPNIRINELPQIARFVEVPNRCIDWRRIRGHIQSDPYGMVFVSQHAPYGTENAYFAHTIQPRFKELTVNGFSIAEIGSALYNLQGIKFLANIGDQASMPEANALCPKVMNIR